MARVRVLTEALEPSTSWKPTNSSPKVYELDDGTIIPLFSDEEVYEATKDLLHDYLDATIESYLGLESTTHLPGVSATVKNDCFSSLHITEQAYEKALCGARLIGEGQMQTPELSYHLLRDRRAPEHLITDVVVGQEQVVNSATCKALSYLDLMYKHEDVAYAGWCHSHGAAEVFHSKQDDKNVKQQVQINGLTKRVFSEYPLTIQYLPSLVINVWGDTYATYCIQYHSYREEKDVQIFREVPVKMSQERFPIDCSKKNLHEMIKQYVTIT